MAEEQKQDFITELGRVLFGIAKTNGKSPALKHSCHRPSTIQVKKLRQDIQSTQIGSRVSYVVLSNMKVLGGWAFRRF